MAFRATLPVCSKASRLPMTSKQGNKDFYKGTGRMPGLGQKAQGRHPRSKAPYIKDPAKMRYFVAPSGWLSPEGALSSLYTSPLKPYVHRGTYKQNAVPKDWPVHHKVSLDLERQDRKHKDYMGIYGKYGFDGEYYIQLSQNFGASSGGAAQEQEQAPLGAEVPKQADAQQQQAK